MTVQLVSPILDAVSARDLTDCIRQAADELWSLLLAAHEGRAWEALGYPTWEAYVRTEFDMSKRHANRLVGQGEVIRAIQAQVGPDGPTVVIQEATARDIKGHLDEVAESVRDAIADVQGDDVSEAETAAIVRDVVERERERIRADASKRLDRLPPDLTNRVLTGGYDLDQAESVDQERNERLDVWADNLREAMRRLARMAGSPVPNALQQRLSEPEFVVLTTIIDALGEGEYGFLE